MGKVGIAAIKYLIKAHIDATGVIERPDVIGAIFGQTEGLLGSGLELRELQKGGRIGRIEVKITSANGKSEGSIEIPTSLNKEDTALIAAALETIDRIGPCDSKIVIEALDDVRTAKRDFVVGRAQALLERMGTSSMGSQELSGLVKDNVRTAELTEYGADRLSGGPGLENESEIILVEGRADVVNLLKQGITNILSVGGTNVSPSLKSLCEGKSVTAFLDGDRGGDLILKTLQQIVTISHVAQAPTGLEVEELTQKDAIKSLRSKVTLQEATTQKAAVTHRSTAGGAYSPTRGPAPRPHSNDRAPARDFRPRGSNRDRDFRGRTNREFTPRAPFKVEYKPEFKSLYKIASSLVGTGTASLLKQSQLNFREVGKVPKGDLGDVLKNLQEGKAQALVVDWGVDQSLVNTAASKGIKYLIGTKHAFQFTGRPGITVLGLKDLVPPAGMEPKSAPAAPTPVPVAAPPKITPITPTPIATPPKSVPAAPTPVPADAPPKITALGALKAAFKPKPVNKSKVVKKEDKK